MIEELATFHHMATSFNKFNMITAAIYAPMDDVIHTVCRYLKHHGFKNIIIIKKVQQVTATRTTLLIKKDSFKFIFTSVSPVITNVEIIVNPYKYIQSAADLKKEEKLKQDLYLSF